MCVPIIDLFPDDNAKQPSIRLPAPSQLPQTGFQPRATRPPAQPHQPVLANKRRSATSPPAKKTTAAAAAAARAAETPASAAAATAAAADTLERDGRRDELHAEHRQPAEQHGGAERLAAEVLERARVAAVAGLRRPDRPGQPEAERPAAVLAALAAGEPDRPGRVPADDRRQLPAAGGGQDIGQSDFQPDDVAHACRLFAGERPERELAAAGAE